MAEVAGADFAGGGLAPAAQGMDQDICEVEQLLALSQRPSYRSSPGDIPFRTSTGDCACRLGA